MSDNDWRVIGVAGAGVMGAGIAGALARAGLRVLLCDRTRELLDRGISRLDDFMRRSVELGKLTWEEKATIRGRIEITTEINEFAGADLVIEAIHENLEAKSEVLARLDRICRPEVILASNTSSISITALGAATGRESRVVGMHFFNPAQLMELVEIIRGYHTSDETVKCVEALARRLGKTTVEVKKDSPGFIVNRLLVAQLHEAARLVEQGIASPRDVDTAVKLGLRHPLGPFELMDLTGIDTNVHIGEYLFAELKQAHFAPTATMKMLVRAGRLGRKTGGGWYDYP